ncbi:polymer-forming protein [Rhodovulum bhavnagarense]|uniref:Polymer-forming protein n=1 Tax=Rhodovulum bhavnagarense TaxID=992286 RepID=A0A4R2R8H9_9RHOB|nr:polymer-forming cytoskeletal protein [Rhodovulum bhavnagarense]TCP58504.1 polymer-forming protein [Rhodovulum bhavnagarense]
MPVSTIAPDLTVTGTMRSQSRIDISGRVEGDIEAREIDILNGAAVMGTLKAEAVHLRGTLTGDLQAATAELHSTAVASGDITAHDLVTHKGARIDGRVTVKGAR